MNETLEIIATQDGAVEIAANVQGEANIEAKVEKPAEIAAEVTAAGPQGPQGIQGIPGNDGADGQDGADGVSPVIYSEEITGGHRLTIVDADHPSGQTVDVMDGADGQDGTDGQDGQDGVSPEVEISSITGGHSVKITDADHPSGQTFNVMDGADGQDGNDGADGADGFSPEVTVSAITGGHSVTITDKDHPGGQTFNVMDGQAGSIDIFWCTYNSTTSAQIETALAAAQLPCVVRDDVVYVYAFKTSATKHYFGSTGLKSQQYLYLIEDNGSWSHSYINIRSIPAGGNAGQILKKNSATDYDAAWANQTQDYPSAYCTTAAGTAAKKASCSLWADTANSYLHVLIGAANTSASAITLNVNGTGAKPIYINGAASSATNYTLPAGSYLVFYDGTNFYFRTDGKLTANITGTADGNIPKTGSVSLSAASWSGSGPYTQTVTVTGATVTSSSKVDLQPDATAIQQMVNDGVSALYIENNAGTLTAYAVGASLTANVTVQVTVTEVS